jgi:hypothetical protein
MKKKKMPANLRKLLEWLDGDSPLLEAQIVAAGMSHTLARIMHYAALFCMSGARTRADVPSGENGMKQLVMQRVRG